MTAASATMSAPGRSPSPARAPATSSLSARKTPCPEHDPLVVAVVSPVGLRSGWRCARPRCVAPDDGDGAVLLHVARAQHQFLAGVEILEHSHLNGHLARADGIENTE